MLRRDRDYEEAREDFRPFDRLAAEDSSSRAAVARLCRETTTTAFVIINNKAEGSAPLSVFKLAEEISRYQAIPESSPWLLDPPQNEPWAWSMRIALIGPEVRAAYSGL